MKKQEMIFRKDPENRKLHISRAFSAPLEKVWKAWTEATLLDKWWAPKPYRAETVRMDFREGGYWLYAMVSPEGEKNWCKENFKTIRPQSTIVNSVHFCDENGVETADFPTMFWTKEFRPAEAGTTVNIEIAFDDIADLEKILAMGFEDGFTAGLGNLDEHLASAN
ncbi:MAG: SRPBCC domain-containing protein [Mucilaginibacter polytrichastri]|nr:SRPBCC domain-containing protein [Mucilaginibacter polytrichastri]